MTFNRRTFLRQVGLGVAGAGLVTLVPGCRTRLEPVVPGLPRSTPEAQGISSAAILEFVEAAAREKFELHSFMVVRHGQVVAEGWWSPYAPHLNHTMYSLSKSFTSTAIGFAVAEGRITTDDKVAAFFPDDAPSKVEPNLAALRVRDLLTMSVGNEKEPTQEMVLQENWVKSFLAAPITHPPGTTFLYNSAATYMLSAIVQKVTGQRVLDYLTPRLFEPLGVAGPTWEVCPRGINAGGWGLGIRTEGLARFGQLFLRKGVWNGRRLLPESWVNEATSFKIQQPLPQHPGRPNEKNDWLQGYCYQFWRCTHNAVRGDGAFGQFTVMLPEQDAVVVMTAESGNLQGELDLVWDHLLPAMQAAPLPEDRGLQGRLSGTLAALKLAPPQARLFSPLMTTLRGRTFRLDNNSLNLEAVTFDCRAGDGVIGFHDPQADHAIRFGFESWQRGETALPGTPPRLISGGAPPPGTRHKVAASATWREDNLLELTLRYYETPHRDTVTCRFDGNNVSISFVSSIAAMNPNSKDKRPVLQGTAVG